MRLLSAVATAVVFAGRCLAADRPALPAVKPATQPQLAVHCLECHGPDDANGGVRIDTLPAAIDSIEAAERWQQVLNVLNSGEMPPDEAKQIEPASKADLLDDLAHVMVAARKSLADSGGAVTMRRLNRREYGNTLRDLLGVEIDVQELPADMQLGRFDTVSSGLFIWADQIEQYHSHGMTAIDEAWKRYGGNSEVQKIHVEAEEGTKQTDGSRPFDHTALVFGSNLRSIHYLDNCPTLLAGGGAGIRLGQHLVMPKGTPLCNVWLTLLKGSGIDVASHGDSTGIVEELAGTPA